MAKFRKKPIIREAEQWFPGKRVEGVAEVVHAGEEGKTVTNGYGMVMTANGEAVKVMPGDWVITEPDGVHHYPCKPDIFVAEYEEVEP